MKNLDFRINFKKTVLKIGKNEKSSTKGLQQNKFKSPDTLPEITHLSRRFYRLQFAAVLRNRLTAYPISYRAAMFRSYHTSRDDDAPQPLH